MTFAIYCPHCDASFEAENPHELRKVIIEHIKSLCPDDLIYIICYYSMHINNIGTRL